MGCRYTVQMPTGTWDQLTPYLVLAAAAAIVALLGWLAKTFVRPTRRLPYFSRQTLLSRGEAAFYRVLRTAVPQGAMLCFKVRLCDLIDCDREARRDGFWGKIAQKHIDFVLADADSTAILLAVELDDRTHARKDRRDRDAFVDEALAVAGVPILRVTAAKDYDPARLRADVAAAVRRQKSDRA